MPRIEEVYTDRLSELEKEGCEAVVVEYSVFKNRMSSLAYSADVVIAVLAPLETRIERAVASGFDEGDVRRRIARQITDADRIEAADVVLMDDKPSNIARAISVARKTMAIVWQNIIFAIGVKVIILVLAAFGIANMWLAVFGDVGVTVIAIINAMRAMNVKEL